MTQPTYDIHDVSPPPQWPRKPLGEDKGDDVDTQWEMNPAGTTLSMQRIYQRIGMTPEQLAAFCEKWHIQQLALFGSVLREDFRAEGEDKSDLDLLFTLAAGTRQNLLLRVRMKYELEELCHRSVDLLDRLEVLRSHNWLRRQHILQSERIIYAKE